MSKINCYKLSRFNRSITNINIENMMNKSRGEFAYSVFDVNSDVDESSVKELMNLDGMIRVRVL